MKQVTEYTKLDWDSNSHTVYPGQKAIISQLSYIDGHNESITASLDPEVNFSNIYSGFTPLREKYDHKTELVFPVVIPNAYLLSSNSVTHYRNFQRRGSLLSNLYDSVASLLPKMCIEDNENSHWTVDALVCPSNNSLRDTHNYYPSIKPLVDSLTRTEKFFPDDNFKFVSCYMGFGSRLHIAPEHTENKPNNLIQFNTNGEHYLKQTAKVVIPQALGFIVRIIRYDYVRGSIKS